MSKLKSSDRKGGKKPKPSSESSELGEESPKSETSLVELQLAEQLAAAQLEHKKQVEELLEPIVDPGIDELPPLPRLKPEYDPAGKTAYLEVCKQMGLVPVAYFLRKIEEPVMNLRHRGLGPRGVKAVCQALYTNPFIQTLDLSDNWIRSEGLLHIADLLKESYIISELYLAGNDLRSEGARIIGEVLFANPPHLKILNISDNKFKDKDASLIAYGLEANDRLTEINLSRNEFGTQAGKLFASQISGNMILEKVDLSWNNFRGSGGVALASALRSTTINTIDYSWNGFGEEGAVFIGRSLANNGTLQHLDITNNRISTNGATWIAKGLERNEGLVTLKMGKNPISSEGSLALITSLSKNLTSTLQFLDLNDIYVSKEFNTVYQTLKETRDLTINFECYELDRSPVGLYSRRRQSDYARYRRAKTVSYVNGVRLEHFILALDRETIPTIEFRSLLPKIGKVLADEIAICLSTDGIIHCHKVVIHLEMIPAPELPDKK